MTRIMVDVSVEVLPDLLREFPRHDCSIIGSAECEGRVVRLWVEGDGIPAELDGQLCRGIIKQTKKRMTFSTALSFEAVRA